MLMKRNTAYALVIAAVAGMPAVASAELTGNVGLTSDYLWRGTTQTSGDAAISGGLDYSAPLGFYAGVWTSNTTWAIDNSATTGFVSDNSYELDIYGGYSASFGDFGVDVGYIGYLYPGLDDDPGTIGTNEEGSFDWAEAYVGFSWKMFSLKYSTSDDVFNTGTDASYIEAGADFEIAKDVTLSLHVGKYDFDKDDVNEVAPITDPNAVTFVLDDYTDYSISLAAGDFTITYSDTNLPDDTVEVGNPYGDPDFYRADNDYKVVVTYSKEFSLLK